MQLIFFFVINFDTGEKNLSESGAECINSRSIFLMQFREQRIADIEIDDKKKMGVTECASTLIFSEQIIFFFFLKTYDYRKPNFPAQY